MLDLRTNSFAHGQLYIALSRLERMLTQHIDGGGSEDHAIRSLVRARNFEWDKVPQDAVKVKHSACGDAIDHNFVAQSITIQPSLWGIFSRALPSALEFDDNRSLTIDQGILIIILNGSQPEQFNFLMLWIPREKWADFVPMSLGPEDGADDLPVSIDFWWQKRTA
ncbi:hypothetical protein BDR04DRAFT_1153686 [Suillus decipiens]|nr:hypothetical protein BDR04DRAFT_1153686 [Suillus decipiens]